MAKCKFTGTDPLHFKTYDCTAAAKTDDGYCKRHEFSLNRTLDLIKRVGELEAEKSLPAQDWLMADTAYDQMRLAYLEKAHATLITELRDMAEKWRDHAKWKYMVIDETHQEIVKCADELTALLDKEGNSDG